MSLRERLNIGADESEQELTGAVSESYLEIKSKIHQTLLDRVDLKKLTVLDEKRTSEELKRLIEQIVQDEDVILNNAERKNLIRDLYWEITGLGPLEALLSDDSIADILVNTYNQIYIEKNGLLKLTNIVFNSESHLMKIIDKIVSRIGRRVDEASPMVDARLEDGSRVNVIVPPLAIDGAMMSIRRFSKVPLRMGDLLKNQTLTEPMAECLKALATAKMNIIISGGTGSGKTTLLNILSAAIPTSERIITIEDAAELQLQQPHVVRLETRPANIEGKGEVPQRLLVRNALRMRPDRIILGEVRGPEAFDMLQAMNTGHEGSMATIHANTPRDALSRLENMINMAGVNLTDKAVRQQISSAISVIVQVMRLPDGKRKVTSIQEITGMEGDVISTQEIFKFKQVGMSIESGVQGYFSAQGIRPVFQQKLKHFGIELPNSYFEVSHIDERRL